MKYLLDTDVIVDHFRGAKRLAESIVAEGVGISLITYGELLYGAEKSDQPEKTRDTVSDFVQDLEVNLLSLNKEIMQVYAGLKADLEKKGQRLDEFDLLIASTAKVNNLTLVTRNLKHYQRVPNLDVYK